MLDKLFEYLRAQPDGATVRELAGLVFSGGTSLAEQTVESALRDDPRFVLSAHGRWELSGASTPARPIADTSFVVFDLETTDQGRGMSSIVEFGAVRIHNGKVVEHFQQLINPGVKLSPFVAKLTGINDALLAEQPPLGDVWPQIAEFIGDNVLVAHNAAYDIACLNSASVICDGRALGNDHVCTFKLSRRLLPDLTRRGLDSLAGHFGIPTADRHRALADAKLTAEVFFHLIEQLGEREIHRLEQLLEFQDCAADGRPFVCSLPRAKVEGLPPLPGVYRLLSAAGDLLYIGRAKNLRERVGSYLSNAASHSDKTLELIREAHDLRVDVLGSELQAALAEAAAIHREQPPYNRLAKHLPRIGFVRLHLHDKFPRVSVSGKVKAGGDRYLGPFKSRKDAGAVADLLVKLFRLRTCVPSLNPDPEVEPCEQFGLGLCSAPCASRADADAYASQIRDCLDFLTDPSTDAARGPSGRSLSVAEHRALRSLQRLRRDTLWNGVQVPSFLVFQQAAGVRAVLAFAVWNGELAIERWLHGDDDVAALAQELSGLEQKKRSVDRHAVDGLTILAAWLRERDSAEGYVFPLGAKLTDSDTDDWQAAVRSMLTSSIAS